MSSVNLLRAVGAPVILLPLVLACAPAGHDHDHAAAVRQTTVWSETHEILVEHPPLVAGTPATLLVHATDLATGKPVTGDGLELAAVSPAGATVTVVANTPRRPGIFAVDLTLPAPGVWNLQVTVPGAAAPTSLPLVEAHADEHAAFHGDETDHPAGHADGEHVDLAKEKQWRLGVRTAPADRDTFVHRVRVAATVEAPPARRLTVTTPVAGCVAPPSGGVLPTLGDRVTAGQELARLRAPLTGDAADLAAAEAAVERTRQDLHLAEAELERARTLVEADAAPARRLEEAAAQVAAARADHAAARRLVHGDEGPELPLTAPIDGVVVTVTAGPGEYVEAGSAVFAVLDPSLVWVRGWIPESSLPHLPPRPEAILECPGHTAACCADHAPELVYLAPEIDPASRTAAVVYAVANADGHLRVGQSLGLRLETDRRDRSLVVPHDALVDEHGRPVVFVQTGGETFVKRHVTVGGDDTARVVILAGVAEGERVVVDGAWAVKLAAAGTATPGHGHTH